MAYEQKDNSGTVFKGDKDKPGANPNWPDYKGDCMIDGKSYWMSGWIKTSGPTSKTPGAKFMSFAFKPKEMKGDITPKTNTTTVMNETQQDANDAGPPF